MDQHDYDNQLASLAGVSRPPIHAVPKIHWPREVAVVDLETTGLSPTHDEVTEIAVIRCDNALQELRRIHIKVQTPPLAECPDQWVRENTEWGRADRGAWNREASPVRLALESVGPLLEGAALIAHYLPFEGDWLATLYGLSPEGTPGRSWILGQNWRRCSVDTRDLAAPLRAQGYLSSRSLSPIARYLGVEIKHRHSAIDDAQATLEIARMLLGAAI